MSCFVRGVEVVVEVLRFSVGVDLCGENFWLFWHRWGRIDIDFDGMNAVSVNGSPHHTHRSDAKRPI